MARAERFASSATLRRTFDARRVDDLRQGPGEVRCHNVDLNGGLWWVVGPDVKRRP